MSDPVVLLSTGDVVGPAGGVTNNSMVLFSGTSGKLIKGNNAVVTAAGLALLDDVDAAAQRVTLDLGTAATATLTTSATDTTEGSVLKVGDFGVGMPIPTTNLDTLTGTGLFSCGNVTGTPGTAYLGWWVHQIDAGPGFWKNQTAWMQGNPSAQYVRTSWDGTTWSPWVPVVFNNSPAFTGTPTAPTAAAGTNTTQLATTEFAHGLASKAQSGYVKLPNGVIIQWGVLTSVALNQTFHQITFPITFPNSAANISATIGMNAAVSGSIPPVVRNLVATGVQIAGDPDTTTATGDIYWSAIGY